MSNQSTTDKRARQPADHPANRASDIPTDYHTLLLLLLLLLLLRLFFLRMLLLLLLLLLLLQLLLLCFVLCRYREVSFSPLEGQGMLQLLGLSNRQSFPVVMGSPIILLRLRNVKTVLMTVGMLSKTLSVCIGRNWSRGNRSSQSSMKTEYRPTYSRGRPCK